MIENEPSDDQAGRVPLRKLWSFFAVGAGFLVLTSALFLVLPVIPIEQSIDVEQSPNAALMAIGIAIYAYLAYQIWNFGPRAYLQLAGMFPDAGIRNRVLLGLARRAAPIGLIIVAPLTLSFVGGPDWLDIFCFLGVIGLYEWSKRFRGPAVTDALTQLSSG